jgi:hypothetical protein
VSFASLEQGHIVKFIGQNVTKGGPSTVLQEPLGKYLYEALTHRNAGRTKRLDQEKRERNRF